MAENTNNYSDEWQPYNGDYDKFEYDIKLKDGRIIYSCYPNGGDFDTILPENEGESFADSEVKEIRFAKERRLFPNNRYSTFLFAGYIDTGANSCFNPTDYMVKERIPKGTLVSVRIEPKKTRNAICECGSGRKYKKCCISIQV